MARILKDTEKKLSPEFQNRLKEFIDDNEWNNEQFASLVGVSKPVILRATIYGIIPAFYPIQEHRHDFHTKVKVNCQSLKNYWRAEYDQFLEDSQVPVVSLLSSEFEDVFSPSLRKQLFTVSFMEDRNGILKTHSTISKKARGAFLTAVMEESCQTIDALRDLSFDDFYYRKDLSSDSELFFVRKVKKA